MRNQPQTPRFSADQPLVNPADDRLNRDDFSAEIARSVANWTGHDSLVLSLTGEWGSGKSTIKNFVIHHLANKATVLEFNPWQWSGQDKLMEAFLWQLGSIFGKKDVAKKTRKLASKWEAFAAMIQIGGEVGGLLRRIITFLLSGCSLTVLLIVVFGAPRWAIGIGAIICLILSLSLIARVTEHIARVLKAWAIFQEKSPAELRSEIDIEMRNLDKPIVVFIDDIDRLTNAEIKLLIQLVKANVQFPNLVYFLLFQKSIVVKALGEITSDNGAKYLRKIIQVEFDVPAASEKQMRAILTRGLDQIINSQSIRIRWDPAYWQSIFLDDLWPYFTNLRDIKRFLGSFEFYFNLHVNDGTLEVNPVDLIAMEILRMFDHDTFLAISRSFLRRDSGIMSILYREETMEKDYREQIESIVNLDTRTEAQKNRLRHLLQALFPQATGRKEYNEWKRDFRVCDEFSFYKYFQVSIDPAKPTAHEITRFVNVSNDRASMANMLREAINKNTIEDLLDFILVTREELPLENMPAVATAIFDIGDYLPEQKASMFSTGLEMQCNRIIYHRLKHEDQKRSSDILWQAYRETTGFILPIRNLSLEDKRVRERGEKTTFIIAENRLNDFTTLTLERIRSKAEDFTLVEHKDCGLVLYLWKEWSNDDEVNNWLLKAIADPERAVAILRHLMSVVIIDGVKKEAVFHGESVEKLIPLKVLYDGVNALPSDKLMPEDRANILLLSEAIARKAAGKPYTEVRPKDSRF